VLQVAAAAGDTFSAFFKLPLMMMTRDDIAFFTLLAPLVYMQFQQATQPPGPFGTYLLATSPSLTRQII